MKKENMELGKVHKADFQKEPVAPDAWFGVRHTQVLLLFLLVSIGYGMRVNLSVAIVAMTDPTANPDYDFPIYDWHDKSIVLSSFFWGYALLQVGAGQLATRYGPRWFLVTAMSLCSLASITTPLAASYGSWAVMVCRVVQGLCQGFFFPSTHNLLSKWAPKSERSRLGTLVYAGTAFGTVVSMPITGWISGGLMGWPSVFYVFGASGFAWVVMWIILGANRPAEHKGISAEERAYIETSLGDDEKRKVPKTPWGSIATSVPVWALLVTHCGQNWSFWTLLTEIPTFMNGVLNFNIKSNGVLSALPYLVMGILCFVFSPICDWVINNRVLSIGATRKMINSVGHYLPAVALLLLATTTNPSTEFVVTLLVIAVGLNSATLSGLQINHVDLSPTHSGILMGITNGTAAIFSIIAPMFVQYVVTDETNKEQWKLVFLVAAAVFICCNTVFVLFGSGDLQYWNDEIEPMTKSQDSAQKNKEDEAARY